MSALIGHGPSHLANAPLHATSSPGDWTNTGPVLLLGNGTGVGLGWHSHGRFATDTLAVGLSGSRPASPSFAPNSSARAYPNFVAARALLPSTPLNSWGSRANFSDVRVHGAGSSFDRITVSEFVTHGAIYPEPQDHEEGWQHVAHEFESAPGHPGHRRRFTAEQNLTFLGGGTASSNATVTGFLAVGMGVEPNFLVTPGSQWLEDWLPPMPDWLAVHVDETDNMAHQSRVHSKGVLRVDGGNASSVSDSVSAWLNDSTLLSELGVNGTVQMIADVNTSSNMHIRGNLSMNDSSTVGGLHVKRNVTLSARLPWGGLSWQQDIAEGSNVDGPHHMHSRPKNMPVHGRLCPVHSYGERLSYLENIDYPNGQRLQYTSDDIQALRWNEFISYNRLDAISGHGSCDALLAAGHYRCEEHFCEESFRTPVTTGLVTAPGVSASSTVLLAVDNPRIRVGHTVTATGVSFDPQVAPLPTVTATTGSCTGTDDGSGTTATTSTPTLAARAVTFAAPPNPLVRVGRVVDFPGKTAVATIVESVTGICTGSDDGSGNSCVARGDGSACAVLGPGNNCVFAATAMVMSSRQDIPAGTEIVFTTPCSLNSDSSACAVTESGHNCVYAADTLALSRNVDAAAGTILTFNEAVACPNATMCDYSCGYCASAPVEIRGQMHVADRVEFFSGQPNLGSVRTWSGDVDMALSTASSARVAGHLNVTNRSYAVAVTVYSTDGFKLNILFEMLNNSGVAVEEVMLKDGGFPTAVQVDHLEELRPGQATHIETTTMANGTVTLRVDSSNGMPTGGAPCFFDIECGHGVCNSTQAAAAYAQTGPDAPWPDKSRCICDWGWTGPTCLNNALGRGGVDESRQQYVALVLQNEMSEFQQLVGEGEPVGSRGPALAAQAMRTSLTFNQAYHRRQPQAATGRPQPPPVASNLLLSEDFNSGVDSLNRSAGAPALVFAGAGAAAGFTMWISDDGSEAPPQYAAATGAHITQYGCGHAHAGSADLAVGASNEWVLPFWNQHRSGLVLNFSHPVDAVALDDNDDDSSPKVLYAFDENGTVVGQTPAQANVRFALDLSDTCGARIHAVEFDTAPGMAGGAADDSCFTVDNVEVRGHYPGAAAAGSVPSQLQWYPGCHNPEPWKECALHSSAYQSYNLYDAENDPTGSEDTCADFIADGRYSCATDFCPSCPYAGYCNASCGFCFVPERLINAPSYAASLTAGSENADGTERLDPAVARDNEAQWYGPAPGPSQNAYLSVGLESGALGRHEVMRLRSDGNFSAAWRNGHGDQIRAQATGENYFAGSWTVSGSERASPSSAGTLTGNGFVGADFSGAGLGTQPLVLTVDGSGASITVSLTAAMSSAGDVVAALNADGAFAAAAVASVDGSEVKITSRTTGPLSSVAIETGSSGANAQALFGSSPVVATGASAAAVAPRIVTVQGCTQCSPLQSEVNRLRARCYGFVNASECSEVDGCAVANDTLAGPVSYAGQDERLWSTPDRPGSGMRSTYMQTYRESAACVVLPTYVAAVLGNGMTAAQAAILLADPTPCRDCRGEVNGPHVLDPCGQCWAPNDPRHGSSCSDCNGTVFGNWTRDACGICLAPDDMLRNAGCLDCRGTPNGNATVDVCGLCLHHSDPLYNATCTDCAGVPAGLAIIDRCGECQVPGSRLFEAACTDCAGVLHGRSELDSCGVCHSDTDPTANSSCTDCNGVVLGGFTLDACGVCMSPHDPARNASCTGCDGIPGSGLNLVACAGSSPTDQMCGSCDRYIELRTTPHLGWDPSGWNSSEALQDVLEQNCLGSTGIVYEVLRLEANVSFDSVHEARLGLRQDQLLARNYGTFTSGALTGGSLVPFDFSGPLATENLVVVVDGGTDQVFSLSSDVADAADVVATLVGLVGASASVAGASIMITSTTTGPMSTVSINPVHGRYIGVDFPVQEPTELQAGWDFSGFAYNEHLYVRVDGEPAPGQDIFLTGIVRTPQAAVAAISAFLIGATASVNADGNVELASDTVGGLSSVAVDPSSGAHAIKLFGMNGGISRSASGPNALNLFGTAASSPTLVTGVSEPSTEFVQLVIGHWSDPGTTRRVRLKISNDIANALAPCVAALAPVLNASAVPADCLGSTIGSRSIAPCGQCAVPTSYSPTGLEQWDTSVCFADCNGDGGGGHRVDACGICLDPVYDASLVEPRWNTACADCAETTNGNKTRDFCGRCLLERDPVFNGSCTDCAGAPGGSARVDQCGHCLVNYLQLPMSR
eukprot:SAG31_NODE_168_length_21484_cov_21.524994_11_plen_2243_part_00